MKKITLFYLLLLTVSSVCFAQVVTPSITWNNPVPAIYPGQTVSFDVSYDVGTDAAGVANDFGYFAVILREINADGSVIVKDYMAIFPVNESEMPQPNAQENVTFDYVIDPTAPDSTELDPGNQYIMIVFVSYNNDGGFANNNLLITVDSSLSVGDYNKQNFTAFYPNPVKDIMYFDTNNFVEEKRYDILDVSGRIVKSEKAEKSINLQDLTSGVYFIKTEAGGVGKFVKSSD